MLALSYFIFAPNAELDRKFEESYFDTHTSEVEEEQPQPVINPENQEE